MKRQQDCVGRERNAVNLHDWETEWRKKREQEQRESHAHHSSPCVAYRAWENRRDLTFSSFPHQTCSVSLLSPSITISAGPLKWQEVRETSGEGRKTIKRGLYFEWREKEKSALSHTCLRRDWIYCSPPFFYGVFLWSRVCLMKSEHGIMGKCLWVMCVLVSVCECLHWWWMIVLMDLLFFVCLCSYTQWLCILLG